MPISKQTFRSLPIAAPSQHVTSPSFGSGLESATAFSQMPMDAAPSTAPLHSDPARKPDVTLDITTSKRMIQRTALDRPQRFNADFRYFFSISARVLTSSRNVYPRLAGMCLYDSWLCDC